MCRRKAHLSSARRPRSEHMCTTPARHVSATTAISGCHAACITSNCRASTDASSPTACLCRTTCVGWLIERGKWRPPPPEPKRGRALPHPPPLYGHMCLSAPPGTHLIKHPHHDREYGQPRLERGVALLPRADVARRPRHSALQAADLHPGVGRHRRARCGRAARAAGSCRRPLEGAARRLQRAARDHATAPPDTVPPR